MKPAVKSDCENISLKTKYNERIIFIVCSLCDGLSDIYVVRKKIYVRIFYQEKLYFIIYQKMCEYKFLIQFILFEKRNDANIFKCQQLSM